MIVVISLDLDEGFKNRVTRTASRKSLCGKYRNIYSLDDS